MLALETYMIDSFLVSSVSWLSSLLCDRMQSSNKSEYANTNVCYVFFLPVVWIAVIFFKNKFQNGFGAVESLTYWLLEPGGSSIEPMEWMNSGVNRLNVDFVTTCYWV